MTLHFQGEIESHSHHRSRHTISISGVPASSAVVAGSGCETMSKTRSVRDVSDLFDDVVGHFNFQEWMESE